MIKEKLVKEGIWVLGGIVLLVLILFVFSSGIRKSDVSLCKETFKGLIEGRQGAQKFIDWGNLKALGLDVGETYNKLPNLIEKSAYRREFIKNLSSSFKQAGGRFEAFSGWRIYKQGALETIVAADYKAKKKVILFTLSGYGQKKLTAIQWEADNE